MPVTLNYIRDVQPFDDAEEEWTDTDIANEVEGQTFNPINTLEGRAMLASLGWWVQSDDVTYTGIWEQIYLDAGTPIEYRNLLKDPTGQRSQTLWTITFTGSLDYPTDLRLRGNGTARPKQAAGLIGDFLKWAIQQGYTTQNDTIEFYSLGGGLKYLGQNVTAADVANARAQHNNDQQVESEAARLSSQYTSLYNTHVAPILGSTDLTVLTDENVKLGIQAMHDNWVDGA